MKLVREVLPPREPVELVLARIQHAQRREQYHARRERMFATITASAIAAAIVTEVLRWL